MDKRIDELKKLKKGWLDGDGEPLDPEGVEWARPIINAISFWTDSYGLYPTLQGNLQLEADSEGVDVTMLFDLKQKKIMIEGTPLWPI